MTDQAGTLDLEPQGDDFLLKRVDGAGQETSIILSPDDVLTLAQSVQKMRQAVHAKRTPQVAAHPGVLATPVAQVGLDSDVHQTEVLMQMIGRNGSRLWFALPLEVAKPVSERGRLL